MDEYIKEYLLQHEKVQVDNFGIFEIVYKPAQIHPILHTFTVPGRYVVFSENSIACTNEFSNFVALKESITTNQADDRVQEWVKTIKDTISSKKEYQLSSLGKFFLNAMGRIEFVPSLDSDISPESYGLEDFAASLPSKKEVNPEKNIDLPKNVVEENSIPEKETVQKQDISHNEEMSEQSNTNERQSTDEPQEEEEPAINKNTKKRKPGRIALLIVLFLLLFGALGIGITYFMCPEVVMTYTERLQLFKDGLTKKPKEDQQISKQNNIAGDSLENEGYDYISVPDQVSKDIIKAQELKSEPISSKKEEVVTKKAETTQMEGYYVIIGSFQESANAQAFLDKSRKEYPNVVDLGKGRNSTLFMIGIGPYKTKAEAEEQIQRGLKGWVLKK